MRLFALEGNLLRPIRDFSDEEALLYRQSVEHLLRLDESDLLSRIVQRNRNSFESGMSAHTPRGRTVRETNEIAAERQADITARLLNFLSAFRLFLDHSETRLKRQYGHDSDIVATFKKACTQSYDSVFAYRFLYKLRNYVQHCGLRVGDLIDERRIRAATELEVDQPSRCTFNTLDLVREGEDHFGPTLVKELRAGPTELDVQPLLAAATDEVKRIEQTVSHAEIPALTASAQTLRDLVRAATTNGGFPVAAAIYSEKDRNVLDMCLPPAPLMRALGATEFFDLDEARSPRPAG